MFTCDFRYGPGANQAQLWVEYLQKLESAGHARESGRDSSVTVTQADGHA